MTRNLDLVVYGATGFTGRLVAEHLQRRYGSHGEVAWAMAGRNREKLQAVAREIGAAETLPLITADASDADGLARMAAATRAVITTVGPYQLAGEPLIEACIATGTDYLDLCGEPAWMAQMIRRHHAAAQASGARIVFSCGFDSVPFDLGVVFLQAQALQRWGRPLPQVDGRVLRMKGTFSGGTAASLLATLQAVARDAQAARDMADPFALTPGYHGPAQPDDAGAVLDADTGLWTAPFVMAAINTKNVHRTNHLLGRPYGEDFVYSERQAYGEGRAGELRARGAARQNRLQQAALGFAPSRALIQRFVLPRQGQGPSAAEREAGYYRLQFTGRAPDGRRLQVRVDGERDPGYGSTSQVIAECALGLLHDVDRRSTAGGLWTPGAALGMAVVERLGARAGLRFSVVD